MEFLARHPPDDEQSRCTLTTSLRSGDERWTRTERVMVR
jgi:hypothetical protein